jgi:DNA polymerase-3 subunit alpha
MLSALEVKTSYSILNSLNNIQKLVELAKKYGYTSLAITDEDNMFGVMEFYNECNKNNIKPIIGITLTIDGTKILLYAKNELGYKNLIKLSTIVSSEELTIDILKQYKDDLILIMPLFSYKEEIYKIYKDRFIGYTNKEELKNVIENPVLITNVSYLNKNDYEYLGYANMIKEGKILGEYPLDSHKDNHLLTKEEFANLVNDEVLKNMAYIIANSNVSLTYKEGLLPIYDEKIDSKKYLSELSHKGLKKRLNNNVKPEYIDRLEYELNVIDKMGFNDYFLIVYDYVLYAKKHDIGVGPGRGSAAGSLVSYCLGITDIDPLKYDLLFERFLNPNRVTMPDIDIDFEDEKRYLVIDYVKRKYGSDNVGLIITFSTLKSKQVLRDVARVLEIDSDNFNKLSKLINADNDLKDNLTNEVKELIKSDKDLTKLYKIATKLEGLKRQTSIHAAGVVISSSKLKDIVPVLKTTNELIIGLTMDQLEENGLLKMDFLALKNLSTIKEIVKNINQKDNLDLKTIPLDDAKTYKLLASGNTRGIFQFETNGMQNLLPKLNPTT